MNRGSGISAWARGRTSTCFNEAPIHESGKSLGPLPVLVLMHGFNEAPIHESGKSQGGQRWFSMVQGLQ